MSTLKRDRAIFSLARDYLPSLGISGVTREIVDQYMQPPERPDNMYGIYRRLIESAQNSGSMPNVIGKSLGSGLNSLGIVLFQFDPKKVAAKFTASSDWEVLFGEIRTTLKPSGELREGAHGLWPRFCRTAIDGAKFLSQFQDHLDFYKWADFLDIDDRTRDALPLLLQSKIRGFGMALACDFLKELGYVKFGKPDVQIRDIFKGLKLANNYDDMTILEAIRRIAANNHTTPYAVDKVFWLIGSGYFYNHKKLIGKDGRIPQQKNRFIEFTKNELQL